MEIKLQKFSENDITILRRINLDILNKYIESLMDIKEIMWNHGDTGKKYPLKDLPHSSVQCLPEYPDSLKEMARYMIDIGRDVKCNLYEEGLYDEDNGYKIELGTMYSPTLIISFIRDAYSREHLCDGLFEFGVPNRLYLKLLLHLRDCFIQYKYIDNNGVIIADENINENKHKNFCPICNGKLLLKNGKYGRFYGCINYPKCKFVKKL